MLAVISACLFMLGGCTIIQPVVRDSLNEVGESLNVLSYGIASIVVTPPERGLTDVNVDIQGVALAVTHDACSQIEAGHYACWFDSLTEVTAIPTTGSGVTATGTYRLTGELAIRHEILSN